MLDIKKDAAEAIDYKTIYTALFNALTQVIEILQKAQQDTEELYMSAPSPEDEAIENLEYECDD